MGNPRNTAGVGFEDGTFNPEPGSGGEQRATPAVSNVPMKPQPQPCRGETAVARRPSPERCSQMLSLDVRPTLCYVVHEMSREELMAEALRLPEDQKVSLAYRLLSSIEPPESTEIRAAWDAEIRRRIAAFDRGETQAIPAADVFNEVDRQLKK